MCKKIFNSLILVVMFFSSFSIAYSLEEDSNNNIKSFTGIENPLSETMRDSMLVSNTWSTGSSTMSSVANIAQAGQEGGLQGAATAAMQDENVMNAMGAEGSTMSSVANIAQAGQEGGLQGAATAAMQDENVMNAMGAEGSALGTGMAAYSSFNSLQEGNYGDAAVTLLKDENVASGIEGMMGADGGTVSTGLRAVGVVQQLASGDTKGAIASGAGMAASYYAGAAIGTAIGGPVGTVVGGMIGSYVGTQTSKFVENNPGLTNVFEDPQSTFTHWNTEADKLLDMGGLSGNILMPTLDLTKINIDLSDIGISETTKKSWTDCPTRINCS
jgi:hypothetical protein